MTTKIARQTGGVAVLVMLGFVAATALSRAASLQGGAIAIPANATALEGVPQVRIEVTEEGATRRELDPSEAAGARLTIKVVDGRLYRTEAGDRPLVVTSSPEFTYLSSTEPGHYVRLRKLGDRITYVEHADMPFGSVTYWGVLRIVIGR